MEGTQLVAPTVVFTRLRINRRRLQNGNCAPRRDHVLTSACPGQSTCVGCYRSNIPRAVLTDSRSFSSEHYRSIHAALRPCSGAIVMAAVRVVLPWSTWPIVPTFTCGLSRLKASLAISPV